MKLDHAARNLCKELRKSQTRAELLFWKKVRGRKFSGLKFYRQYPIFYEFNNLESFFIADFYCFEKRTVIEIDGKIHDNRKREDEKRSEILRCLGLKIMRIKIEDIMLDINVVLDKLSTLLAD
jgi:very-short-patch-repair endonuclease